jgi:hypothetical protein
VISSLSSSLRLLLLRCEKFLSKKDYAAAVLMDGVVKSEKLLLLPLLFFVLKFSRNGCLYFRSTFGFLQSKKK